jgi:hypothetical protein
MTNGKEIAFSCFISGSVEKTRADVVSDNVGCGLWWLLGM